MTLTTPVAEQQSRSWMQPPQPDKIERFLRTAEFLVQLIDKVWQSDLIPVNYRGSRTERYSDEKVKANLLAAGLLGDSLGVDPFMAWSNIYPTQAGKLGLSADFKVALVTGRGHEIETVKRTPTECVVRARRKGSDLWQEVTITIQDAKQANWTRNPVYGTRPEDMLFHRARGRAADMVAPDATHGIPTVDDLEDHDPVPEYGRGREIEAARIPPAKLAALQPGDRVRSGIVGKLIEERQPLPPDSALAELVEHTRREREQIRAAEAALAVEADEAEAVADTEEIQALADEAERGYEPERLRPRPDLVAEAKRVMEEAGIAVQQLSSIADNTADVEDTGPTITPQDWAKINGLFRAVGITGVDQATADARLRVIRFVIGRPVERGSQMTRWEGEQVMQYLDGAAPHVVQAIARNVEEADSDQ